MKNYSESRAGQPLIASLSEMWSLSPSACATSSLGQAILDHVDKVLWVVSASNSAGELSLESNACPQTINSPNLLKVASSGDGKTLAPSSSFGAYTVQIAELGCTDPTKDSCDPNEAATSFAAPRLARKAAGLSTKYPHVKAADTAFALMATAKVPSNWRGELAPLAVISGGVADAEAADKLLAAYDQWPSDRNLNSRAWIKLLSAAKADQYSDFADVDYLVSEQAKLLMERGNFR